jgi:hypothetical protein
MRDSRAPVGLRPGAGDQLAGLGDLAQLDRAAGPAVGRGCGRGVVDVRIIGGNEGGFAHRRTGYFVYIVAY